MNAQNTKSINVRLRAETFNWIEKRAERHDKSLNFEINTLLGFAKDYLEEKEEKRIDNKILKLYEDCNDLGLELRHPTKCTPDEWLGNKKLRSKIARGGGNI